jgi:hypothetical protein
MAPEVEERFQRIEADLTTAAGLLVQISDRLDGVSARLDRAVHLGVREARNERRKRRDLTKLVEDLGAAQRVTELKLQTFIDSLQRGGNGHA